jgi:hypothetical protein
MFRIFFFSRDSVTGDYMQAGMTGHASVQAGMGAKLRRGREIEGPWKLGNLTSPAR